MREAPLFVRVYDLHAWLLDRLEPLSAYPSLRATVLTHSRQLLETVVLALKHFEPAHQLLQADEATALLRIHLRLCFEKRLLDADQLRFAVEALADIGRQLGGWRRRLHTQL